MEIVISRLHYIPYFGVVVGVSGILTSYAVAVGKGDVLPWLPYISDAGGDPPQSSVFSFAMVLVALCFLVGCCLCYLIITVMNSSANKKVVKWLSRLIPLAGAGASAGMVLLAVNPVGHLRKDGTWLYPIFVPHIVGAVTMFGSGISLMWILAGCNYFLDHGALRSSFYIRVLMAAVGVISGFMTIIYCPVTSVEQLQPVSSGPRMYPDGMIVSTISEWIVVITFLAFTLSFAAEFRKFKLTLKLEYITADQNSSRAELKTPPVETSAETSLKEATGDS